MNMTPRWCPKCFKIAPRCPKDAPWMTFFRSWTSISILYRFWIDFGSVLPPQMPPFGILFAIKVHQQIDPKSDCSKSRSKITPRSSQDASRTPADTIARESRNLFRNGRTPEGGGCGCAKRSSINKVISFNPLMRFKNMFQIKCCEFLQNWGCPNMSSRPYTQLFMRNPNPRSKILKFFRKTSKNRFQTFKTKYV